MPRAVKGVLVRCDPSIKACIEEIDKADHSFIVEDLDEETLVVKVDKIEELKAKLQEMIERTQQLPNMADEELD